MSAFGLTLVLLATCCHTIWNYFVKRINGGPELVWLFSFVSVCIYRPLAVYIWFFETQSIGARGFFSLLPGVFILKEGSLGKRMFWSLLVFFGIVLLASG